MTDKTDFTVLCNRCSETHVLQINATDVESWQNGRLIQDAMPYLSADERELLISGMCGVCFDRLFSGDA